eukprot:gene33503-43295_t
MDPLESKREHVAFLRRYREQQMIMKKYGDPASSKTPPSLLPPATMMVLPSKDTAVDGTAVKSSSANRVEVLDINKAFLVVPPTETKRSPVIATMVTSQTSKYLKCLQYFLLSLEATGYNSEVLILIAEHPDPLKRPFSNTPNQPHLRKLTIPYEGKLNLKEIYVPTIELTNHFDEGSRKYSKTLTKLHLWALHTYSVIVYYDLDFIFLKNPIPAATIACSSTKSSLCATVDEGMVKYFGRPAGRYFNSGFIVLKPSLVTYETLLAKKNLAESKQFPDQDYLNDVFEDDWGRLSEEFNRMHVTNVNLKHVHGGINSHTVALHEKYWVLRENFPDPNYIWNRIKRR